MSNKLEYRKMLTRIVESSGAKFPVTLLELEFLADAIAAVPSLSDFGKICEAQKCIDTLQAAGLWNDDLCDRFFMLQCVRATCQRDEYCGENCKHLRKG